MIHLVLRQPLVLLPQFHHLVGYLDQVLSPLEFVIALFDGDGSLVLEPAEILFRLRQLASRSRTAARRFPKSKTS